MNNTGFIHEDDSKKRHEEWQKNNRNTVIKVGGFVKLAFEQDGNVENMFVEVTGSNDQVTFTGVLDNYPIFLTGLKIGDPVTFDRKDIQQYLDPDIYDN